MIATLVPRVPVRQAPAPAHAPLLEQLATLRRENVALWAENAALRVENGALHERMGELEARLGQTSTKRGWGGYCGVGRRVRTAKQRGCAGS
jgi:regulator of replication initiation timing